MAFNGSGAPLTSLNASNISSGTLPVARGGTGAGDAATARANLGAGTGNGNGNGNGNGTVTSVATGNGLQGGTITSTGTLSVACPGFNTVGSYCQSYIFTNSGTVTSGANYSAGAGTNQMQSGIWFENSGWMHGSNNNLSGTWKWMSATNGVYYTLGLACRVS